MVITESFLHSSDFTGNPKQGTPNREPQEDSRDVIGIYLPGSSYSVVFLLYSWRSLFGVPIRTLIFIHEVHSTHRTRQKGYPSVEGSRFKV